MKYGCGEVVVMLCERYTTYEVTHYPVIPAGGMVVYLGGGLFLFFLFFFEPTLLPSSDFVAAVVTAIALNKTLLIVQ